MNSALNRTTPVNEEPWVKKVDQNIEKLNKITCQAYTLDSLNNNHNNKKTTRDASVVPRSQFAQPPSLVDQLNRRMLRRRAKSAGASRIISALVDSAGTSEHPPTVPQGGIGCPGGVLSRPATNVARRRPLSAQTRPRSAAKPVEVAEKVTIGVKGSNLDMITRPESRLNSNIRTVAYNNYTTGDYKTTEAPAVSSQNIYGANANRQTRRTTCQVPPSTPTPHAPTTSPLTSPRTLNSTIPLFVNVPRMELFQECSLDCSIETARLLEKACQQRSPAASPIQDGGTCDITPPFTPTPPPTPPPCSPHALIHDAEALLNDVVNFNLIDQDECKAEKKELARKCYFAEKRYAAHVNRTSQSASAIDDTNSDDLRNKAGKPQLVSPHGRLSICGLISNPTCSNTSTGVNFSSCPASSSIASHRQRTPGLPNNAAKTGEMPTRQNSDKMAWIDLIPIVQPVTEQPQEEANKSKNKVERKPRVPRSNSRPKFTRLPKKDNELTPNQNPDCPPLIINNQMNKTMEVNKPGNQDVRADVRCITEDPLTNSRNHSHVVKQKTHQRPTTAGKYVEKKSEIKKKCPSRIKSAGSYNKFKTEELKANHFQEFSSWGNTKDVDIDESHAIYECRNLQQKLIKHNISVTVDDLKRALLPPKQYASSSSDQPCLPSYSSGLLSYPRIWLASEYEQIDNVNKLCGSSVKVKQLSRRTKRKP